MNVKLRTNRTTAICPRSFNCNIQNQWIIQVKNKTVMLYGFIIIASLIVLRVKRCCCHMLHLIINMLSLLSFLLKDTIIKCKLYRYSVFFSHPVTHSMYSQCYLHLWPWPEHSEWRLLGFQSPAPLRYKELGWIPENLSSWLRWLSEGWLMISVGYLHHWHESVTKITIYYHRIKSERLKMYK